MHWALISLVCLFTVISASSDAYAFVHAAEIWRDGRVVWPELMRSTLGFAVGVAGYFMAVRFLGELGVRAAEVQTLLWFVVTIVGVAVASGEFARWGPVDRGVGIGCVVAICWLLIKGRG